MHLLIIMNHTIRLFLFPPSSQPSGILLLEILDNCDMLLVTLSQDTNWSAMLLCRLVFLHLDFLHFLRQSLRVYPDGCHTF